MINYNHPRPTVTIFVYELILENFRKINMLWSNKRLIPVETWNKGCSPYEGDTIINEEHYANYMLKNLTSTGEFFQTKHYNSLFRKGLRKAKIKSDAVVCEVGSGCGYFTALLSKYSFVKTLYSVEYSLSLVDKVMPHAFKRLRAKIDKIHRICGSFLNIKLDSESIDIVVANCSLHHSHDIKKTLEEIYRVLKNGGYIFVIERAHEDNVKTIELNRMLMKEKSVEKAEKMYGVSGKVLNRKMLGEHEYRICEWLKLFKQSGLSLIFFEWNATSLYRNKTTQKLVMYKNKMPMILQVFFNRLFFPDLFRKYRNLSLFVMKKSMSSLSTK